jgi:glucokinase
VGVDLGATKIEMGLVSPEDQIVARQRMSTDQHQGPEAVADRIAEGVRELEKALPNGETMAALGICSPGPVDHETGMLIDPPNLQGLHNAPLRDMIGERLGIPVVLEHDAKAAGLGDFHFGAGVDVRSMVFIVVGTGVGAAIIVNGQLLRGDHNSAGEIGHTTLDREGALCPCGSRGCVETYTSGPWLARRYARALVKSGMEEPENVTGEAVAELASGGDPIARQIMVQAGEALGTAIATMAMLLDVDLYVVGGSVAKSGDLLLEPARRIVPRYTHQSVGSRVRIVATELDTDGPILGCAWLARQMSA